MGKRSILAIVVLIMLFLLVMIPMVGNVAADHTSKVESKAEKAGSLWKYTYKVTNTANWNKNNITSINITKTQDAGVRLSAGGWRLKAMNGYFYLNATKSVFRIIPLQRRGGRPQTFYVWSPKGPTEGTATTIDDKGGKDGPHSVRVPDSDTSPGNCSVSCQKNTDKSYTYTLSSVDGNVSYLVIFLDPEVTIESVEISDPGWEYYRYTTGDENGFLVLETDTKPVNSTNPEVSISFNAPNSVTGKVDVMAFGFSDELKGPIPQTKPLGGTEEPVNKLEILTPSIISAVVILLAIIASVIYFKRRKK